MAREGQADYGIGTAITSWYTTGLWKWMGRVLCNDVGRMETGKCRVFFWIFWYEQFFDTCSVYLYPSINITRINLKNAAIKIFSWHVHLFAGQFLHDYGGVSMFQWQWMFLSFPFYVFNLHWRMCFSNGENTCYEHQNINEFPVHTKANCVINLSSNLIVPR